MGSVNLFAEEEQANVTRLDLQSLGNSNAPTSPTGSRRIVPRFVLCTTSDMFVISILLES